MEVLKVSGQIRFRNVLKQTSGGRVDIRNSLVRIKRVGCGVKYLHGNPLMGSGLDGALGEISCAFQQRGHSGESVVWILRPNSGVVDEVKHLASAVVQLRYVERTANRTSEALLQEGGLGRGRSSQRIWSSIEGGIAACVKQAAVWFVDVISAAAA